MYDCESILTILVLTVLTGIYLYVLISPDQPHVPEKTRNFVIGSDTKEKFQAFVKQAAEYSSSSWEMGGSGGMGMWDDILNSNKEWGVEGHPDDFFLETGGQGGGGGGFQQFEEPENNEPIVPSEKFTCQEGYWVSMRSEMNYKFLWMHTGEAMWMGATATMDTPLHRKAFKLVPVDANCEGGGWVMLQEGDSKGFLTMVPPAEPESGVFVADAWVVKIGSSDEATAKADDTYHFLLEDEGYMLNKHSMAFVNVMAESEYSVRGHSSGWNRDKPARREYGAMLHFQMVDDKDVQAAIAKEEAEEKVAVEEDKKYVELIQSFPSSTEKRVISFGLYGAKPKYTTGAIRNAELASTYFPGWVCRYYYTSDVPKEVLEKLKALGSELVSIPDGQGYVGGMFWRFHVAADESVDRYIIRDTDSRLNSRDRIAVEDWIESKYPIHILRDHVNHCIVMNGGMWGGTKGAVSNMKEKIAAWTAKDEYMADLHFLEEMVWPEVRNLQVAHDSYCCDRFPNARPFTTKRPITYQHVGQVFDEFENPRLMDIDGFIRGVPTPGSCRKHADWIYG